MTTGACADDYATFPHKVRGAMIVGGMKNLTLKLILTVEGWHVGFASATGCDYDVGRVHSGDLPRSVNFYSPFLRFSVVRWG